MRRNNFVHRQIIAAFIFGVTALIAVGCLGSGLKEDRTAGEIWKRDSKANEYFFARGIACPLDKREKIFLPEVKKANFTFFKGMSEISVEDGKLTFTLSETEATLGWGNYMGTQPVAEIQNMGQQQIISKIKVKQSAGTSTWTARLWRDGKRLEGSADSALAAPNMEEMEFKPLRSDGANPDGLELTIKAEKETRFEIEWLKLIQPTFEGYVRSEFVVPPGKIWRAIANVGSANERHWMGTLTGKATFGFVSKYQKGANQPTGETQFVFEASEFKFHSSSYDWLVIAGTKAQYKGVGSVNGVEGYGFMLSAIDGDLKKGDGVDRFRIKIWDTASEEVIYDNQMGKDDYGDATTELGGGSIVIHSK